MTAFFHASECATTALMHPPGCGAEFERYRRIEVIAVFAWIPLLALLVKTLAGSVFPTARKNNKAQV